jgi:AraC-like DNA-binding protein
MPDGWQRVGFMTAIPDLLRELGLDAGPMLARAGIEPSVLNDPENCISYRALGALLDEAARATGEEHFGLRVGALIRLETFGDIGRLVLNAPTVGQAVTDFVENQHRHVRGSVVYRVIDGDQAVIGYAAYQPGVRAISLLYDCAVLGTATMMRQLVGARPDELHLPRRQPADPAPWHAAFRAPVRFDSEQAAVVYPRSVLARPVPNASATVRRALAATVDGYRLVAEPSAADRVVRLLRPRITRGRTTLTEIAKRMDLHPRTLNRRLRDEGTSFRALLNQARLNVACQMLETTELNVTQIGLMLNYADSAVFSHSFRRLTGQSPSGWRAAAGCASPPDAAAGAGAGAGAGAKAEAGAVGN